MNKKGLELSMTVIVLIILSILIFIGGITMVWKFFAGAEEIKGGIEKQTQDQIEALLRQGTEIVAIPINTKQVAVGKEAVFGLGIRNIEADEQGFYVGITFSGIYDEAGKEMVGEKDYIEQNWLGSFKEQGPIFIDKNKYEILPLRIRAAMLVGDNQNTPKSATIVFNVCVFRTENAGECIPENRANIYNKIRQVFIQTK